MLIMVFSDSHGNLNHMYNAVKARKPDRIIHLGDHYADGIDLRSCFPEIPVSIVKGNCDQCFGAEEELLNFEGKRILITHGHKYGVKSGLSPLASKGEKIGADAVLFGHTHKSFVSSEGLLMMNPGSAGNGYYGVMVIKDGRIELKLENGK